MDQTQALPHPEEMTLEQHELRVYTELLKLYGDNDEIMSALAVAWRQGFSRALRLSEKRDPSLTINPFWR